MWNGMSGEGEKIKTIPFEGVWRDYAARNAIDEELFKKIFATATDCSKPFVNLLNVNFI
jgi:hypothetical protein